MIGSHDSFTYMAARNPLVNVFKGLWRTQDKSIEAQYKSGVRFFDIRLFRDGRVWRAAHGLAEFGMTYRDLSEAARDFAKMFPGCRFRIWLEKGSDKECVGNEVRAVLSQAEETLAKIDETRKVAESCRGLLEELDTAFKEKQATESRFRKIEEKMDRILNLMESKRL